MDMKCLIWFEIKHSYVIGYNKLSIKKKWRFGDCPHHWLESTNSACRTNFVWNFGEKKRMLCRSLGWNLFLETNVKENWEPIETW